MENVYLLAKLFNDGALGEAYSAMPDAPVVVVGEKRHPWRRLVSFAKRSVGPDRRADEVVSVRPCMMP